jgi:nicotinamide-nucleotide amidase
VNIELINTGSELMLGRVLNTHQQWLCRQLADLGVPIQRQVGVSDTAEAIARAVREGLERADLVITTGGLGPTSDDLTRDALARMLGRPLRLDPTVLRHISEFFAQRQRPMPESTRVQAMIPEGAIVLHNAFGTAPGLLIETRPAQAGGCPQLLVMLPGPPRELRPMFTNQVAPILRGCYPGLSGLVCLTLKTTGLGESMVEERIAGSLESLVSRGLELGYCARVGEVDVRLAARGDQAKQLVGEAEAIVRGLLGGLVFGVNEESLEQIVVRELAARRQTLCTAESCTGGMLANRITNVPGASAVFWGGVVSYANEAKQDFLGVQAALLAEHGAVSEPVVLAMAEGARLRCRTDYALSVTGIAGPDGGTEAKPVGTVFIALATKHGCAARRFHNPLDRETFKWVVSQQALDMLRQSLRS